MGNSNDRNKTSDEHTLIFDTWKTVQGIDTKMDTRDKKEQDREDFVTVMTTCYMADKKFLKGIIIVLIILMLMFAGITGWEKLVKFIPFVITMI